jgi:hypothetical protein
MPDRLAQEMAALMIHQTKTPPLIDAEHSASRVSAVSSGQRLMLTVADSVRLVSTLTSKASRHALIASQVASGLKRTLTSRQRHQWRGPSRFATPKQSRALSVHLATTSPDLPRLSASRHPSAALRRLQA